MSTYVNPSTEFEATSAGFPSGASIGVRIVDGRGATVQARTTAGIAEYPPGSGIYTKVMTSPAVAGQYQIVWDSGGADVSWAVEDLIVQAVTPPPPFVPDGSARETLAAVIARVRAMIGDSECRAFSDAEVQDALDARSERVRYVPLAGEPTVLPGGTVTYLSFTYPVGVWEGGYEIVDSNFEVLFPLTADPIKAVWEFSEEPSLPIMLTGTTHDLYGAAADLLMQLSARESASFDVSADGISMNRSQKAAMHAERAREFMAKARTRVAQLVRTDEC